MLLDALCVEVVGLIIFIAVLVQDRKSSDRIAMKPKKKKTKLKPGQQIVAQVNESNSFEGE